MVRLLLDCGPVHTGAYGVLDIAKLDGHIVTEPLAGEDFHEGESGVQGVV
jgi:hypothetical protein